MNTKSEKFKTLRQRARRQFERDKALIQELRGMRVQQGLSQDEVALRMGITQPAVSAIEKGNSDPNLGTIRRMALAVGCQISYIVVPEQGELVSTFAIHKSSDSTTYASDNEMTFSIDIRRTYHALGEVSSLALTSKTAANTGREPIAV